MVANPVATSPGIPRGTSMRTVACLLAPFMELREGMIMRCPKFDWQQADEDIVAAFGAKGLRRVKRLARREAAERLGLV